MQMAVIEGCRNLASMPNAGTSEFGNFDPNVVGLMTEWTKDNKTETRSEDGDLGGHYASGIIPLHLA